MKNHILLLAFLGFVSCAPRVHTSHVQIDTDDESRASNIEALEELTGRTDVRPSATANLPILPVTVVTPPPTLAELGEGEIDRDAFVQFIEEGPPQVFQAMLLAPVLRADNFAGFRIESIAATSGPITTCGLRAGDIVTSINGRDISRVEGFLQVWESMRSADHLQVDIIRGGNARTLAWQIQ